MTASKTGLSREARLRKDKEAFLERIMAGLGPKAAYTAIGRSRSWYESNRRKDAQWAAQVDVCRAPTGTQRQAAQEARTATQGFADFRRRYLRSETFPHQQAWIDVLEGREPTIQNGWRYEPSKKNRLLINTPPNHAKSATVSVDYAVYRICMDPNVRIMLVSKTQAMAKKFLYAVKQRLTHPSFRELQMAYGPVDGWKKTADQWTAQAIYLTGERDSGEKDPTVEALGMGGQIYGARADLIILDDAVTLSNAHQWPDQMDWLRQEVASRLGPAGKLLVIGTRVAAQDLYRELRNPEHYTDAVTPWTYLGQPAVSDSNSLDPDEWVTLWPKSDRPFEGSEDQPDEDGLYPRWTGPRLKDVRNDMGPQKWALVYQQEDVSADMVFDPVAVQGSVNKIRVAGPATPERVNLWGSHRDDVHPEGWFVVCAMDPAMAGDTATVAYAVDRQNRKRFVLDVSVMRAPTPAKIRELIRDWTNLYQPNVWAVEANAFQSFLTQDEETQEFLASKGVPMVAHFTGNNKKDPEFGVASLAPLFGSVKQDPVTKIRLHGKDNLIELPDPVRSAGTRMLIDQLTVWDPAIPTRFRKQDTVMALWFAELQARKVLTDAYEDRSHFYPSKFTARRTLESQAVINLDEWAAGQPTAQYI